jgi:GT2 family glycosyltransferase
VNSFLPVTAVIPVHNRADLLERLLASLRAQTVAVAEILVVDDGSTDGAPGVARAFGCRLLEMRENAGFARAVNRGWRAASPGWIAILNSDVELDPRWLEYLLGHAAAASFAAGTIFDAVNRSIVDGTYDLVSRAACAWRAGHGAPAADHYVPASPIAIAPATACLFRRDVLERLNGFDESYVSWLEDVDLGLRCVREGLAGVYVPDAIAWHHGSASFGRWSQRMVRLISRNQLLLVSRHYDRVLFRSCFWAIIAGQLLWGLVAMRHGATLSWLAGKLDAMRGFRLEGEPSTRLRDFLNASEQEIRTRAHDPYWRWYFRITGVRSAPGAAL